MIKILLACAYCHGPVEFKQGPIELRSQKDSRRLARSAIFTEVKCPKCDSVFAVELNTLRKRKGKRLKALEAEQARIQAEKVKERKADNFAAGEKLLAEPGCTCEKYAGSGYGWERDDSGAWKYKQGRYHDDTGHPLSTGFSRDDATGAMLPTPPRHYRQCALAPQLPSLYERLLDGGSQ